MEFLIQHYGQGGVGWITTTTGKVAQRAYLQSNMWRAYTSGERVCIYDRVETVANKQCHTFFLIGNDTDTFDGIDSPKEYIFGGQVSSDDDIPERYYNQFYLQANEIPDVSTSKYSWTGRGGASITDFIKGNTIPSTPVDGYMCWGIIKPKGGTVSSPGKWYTGNGSYTFYGSGLNRLNFESGGYDTLGLPLYFNENDQYEPGTVFNNDAFNIMTNSGRSLGRIIQGIREGNLLNNYLSDYIVGTNSPNGLTRSNGGVVNTATYNTTTTLPITYAGTPGLSYVGGNRAYDGGWIFYNIYVTQSLEYANDYVVNGTIPPDGYINKINTDGSKDIDPKFSKPKGKENDNDPTNPDDTDNSKRDNQTIKLPKENGVSSPSNNWYQMSKAQLQRFIYYFWNQIGKDSTDWFNDIRGLYNNLSEAVLGVKYFPCSSSWLYEIDTGQPPTITIGRYSTTFQATQIASNSKLTKIGAYAVREKYKNFLDYTATRIELFLPYLGWVELPTQKVMNTKIIVYFGVDMASTQAMFVVKSDGMIVFQSTFNFGIDIPITLSSSVEQVKSAITTGVSLASGALSTAMVSTVNPVAGGMMAISQAQNAIPQGYDSLHMVGNATANSGQLGGKRCAICITRSIPKQPSSYGSRIGFRYNKRNRLRDLSGFTVVETPRVDFTHYELPTEKEIEELYTLMRKGIIL